MFTLHVHWNTICSNFPHSWFSGGLVKCHLYFSDAFSTEILSSFSLKLFSLKQYKCIYTDVSHTTLWVYSTSMIPCFTAFRLSNYDLLFSPLCSDQYLVCMATVQWLCYEDVLPVCWEAEPLLIILSLFYILLQCQCNIKVNVCEKWLCPFV